MVMIIDHPIIPCGNHDNTSRQKILSPTSFFVCGTKVPALLNHKCVGKILRTYSNRFVLIQLEGSDYLSS